MLKRLIAAALILCMVLLTGCTAAPAKDRLNVVAAIFPEYDWVRSIIGDTNRIDLRLLVDDGVDPHSFQPTVGDMVMVSQCDLLIFGGGESDEWIENVEKGSDTVTLELLSLLGDRAHTAEYTEGMQIREEEEEPDEHVWLSLRNAALFCTAITDALCKIDPEFENAYRHNLAQYLEKLNALDEAYRDMVRNAATNTILVCDRFPFRYLTEDYGLRYYAAFPGCSAESGASFETIMFLSERMKEHHLHTLLITEGSDTRIARTVADCAGLDNAEILVLDSMQSVSKKDAENRSYLATMQENLHTLEKALG